MANHLQRRQRLQFLLAILVFQFYLRRKRRFAKRKYIRHISVPQFEFSLDNWSDEMITETLRLLLNPLILADLYADSLTI